MRRNRANTPLYAPRHRRHARTSPWMNVTCSARCLPNLASTGDQRRRMDSRAFSVEREGPPAGGGERLTTESDELSGGQRGRGGSGRLGGEGYEGEHGEQARLDVLEHAGVVAELERRHLQHDGVHGQLLRVAALQGGDGLRIEARQLIVVRTCDAGGGRAHGGRGGADVDAVGLRALRALLVVGVVDVLLGHVPLVLALGVLLELPLELPRLPALLLVDCDGVQAFDADLLLLVLLLARLLRVQRALPPSAYDRLIPMLRCRSRRVVGMRTVVLEHCVVLLCPADLGVVRQSDVGGR